MRGSDGHIQQEKNVEFFNQQFFEEKSDFLCGFEDMSIADVIAFFAIVPFHLTWLENNTTSKTASWVKRMLEAEEIRNHLVQFSGNK